MKYCQNTCYMIKFPGGKLYVKGGNCFESRMRGV